MNTYVLKIALFIAVSVIQIAGGTSCCCFPRFLSSALTVSFQWNVRYQVLAVNLPNESTCPKCCRHRLESKTDTLESNPSSPNGRTARVSGDGKCNCVRHLSICTPDEKPLGVHEIAPNHPFTIAIKEYDCPPNPANIKPAYSPPIFHLYFGRAWQCLACVWKS